MKACILISGATAGIGLETAKILSEQGHVVFASGRNKEKLAEISGNKLHSIYLDVTKPETGKLALEEINSKGYWVQTLINNAGYGQFGAIEEVDDETARKQFDTNVFGAIELTKLVIPNMRKNKSGRIVNISSIAGKVSMPVGGWYSASKYALEALSDALRWELKQFGIKVVLIEPGPIKSEFGNTANKLLENVSANEHYKQFYGFVNNFDKKFNVGGTSKQGAKIIAKAATKKRPKIRYRIMFSAKLLWFMRRLLYDKVWDAAVLRYFKYS